MKSDGLVLPLLVGFLSLTGCVTQPDQGEKLAGLAPAAKPAYQPDAAYIFTNRRLEQVLSSRNGRTLWVDQNGKRFSKDDNFVVPTLSWRTDKGIYTQQVVKGEPDRLFPLGRGEKVWFDVIKTTPLGKQFTQVWRCQDEGARRIGWQQHQESTYLVSCIRYYRRRGAGISEVQRVDYFYAPGPGAVVRTDYIDLRMKKKPQKKVLATALKPRLATAENIAVERDRLKSIASRPPGE